MHWWGVLGEGYYKSAETERRLAYGVQHVRVCGQSVQPSVKDLPVEAKQPLSGWLAQESTHCL